MAADPRPARSRKRAPTPDERAQRDRFKQSVFIACGGECAVHRGRDEDCEGPLEAHHVITQQQLRDEGRHDLLWDWRNGMALCELAHRRHTRAVERVPRRVVPTRAMAFAREHGLEYLIDRYYTQESE